MYKEVVYKACGDRALLMELSDAIEPACNEKIGLMVKRLESRGVKGLTEILPTYRSILFYYDPMLTDYYAFQAEIKKIYDDLGVGASEANYRILHIPVLYGGDMGPDLGFVADHNGLSREEVIKIHTEPEYLVYMLGFTPGFSYLGGLDPRIFTPRLETARLKIAKGSVGIADKQTGIYPIESPGGWRLIGRTPIDLYDPEKDPPVLLRAGDHLKFKSIDPDEYRALEEEKNKGRLSPEIEEGVCHD